ncbi:hypothetical protein COV93_07635 [Candidatus Woesearchaeota archaeon CG11_big_fil_rev_8_21_14_0_20_43_8]|nr:MAG: hypothetical protein COV93_07635 [Candidatus Woesearchaeota archaeon CG11_big_fil_rev_8_21_14_0_20_43_8]
MAEENPQPAAPAAPQPAAPVQPAPQAAPAQPAPAQPQVSADEQIGFHKGALSTLAKERQEMAKIVQIVEQLMQMHIQALKELGVDLERMAQQQQAAPTAQAPPKTDKPIDDLLR